MRTFVLAGLALSLPVTSVFVFAQQSRPEKIAVAASGKTPSALVSSQPGRSPFFLFFDKKGTFMEAVDNPYKDAGSAGISALEFLASKGVTVLVAEAFGPRIVEVMQGKGIKPIEFKGVAANAVRSIVETR